jgi:hypothetical protein
MPRSVRVITTITHGHANAARSLADEYPRAERAEAERLFGQLLARYAELEGCLGLRPGDVAGALAVFLGASVRLHHEASVSDADIATLADTLRPQLVSDREFGSLTDSKRRYMFEVLAIVGTLMTTASRTLAGSPRALLRARFQQVAGAYLRAFLGGDPGQFAIRAGRVQLAGQRAPRVRRRSTRRG